MRISISRRGALRSILGMTAAAVATQFGISEVVAQDIQLELKRDLGRTLVAMPGQTLLDKKEIWFSVANVAHVWVDELTRQNPELKGDRRLVAACKRMARAIDEDCKTAKMGVDTKVIVEIPRLGFTTANRTSTNHFELRAGVEQTATLWTTRTRIGYIGGGIITGEKVDLARRSLFGLK